ncbi:hypothetical protein [Escherichia phage FL15]
MFRTFINQLLEVFYCSLCSLPLRGYLYLLLTCSMILLSMEEILCLTSYKIYLE